MGLEQNIAQPRIKKHTLLAGIAGVILGFILSILTMVGAMDSISPIGRFQLGVFLALAVSWLIYYLQVYVSGGLRGFRLYFETFLSIFIMEFVIWAVMYDVLT